MSTVPPIAVIGAGSSGLATTAHLLSQGEKVHLWNRSNKKLLFSDAANWNITVSGAFYGNYRPTIITHDIQKALDSVRLILVTVPAHAHNDVVMEMAPHVRSDQVILLMPGRTGGAIAAKNIIQAHGNAPDIQVAESQTIVYTCRRLSYSSVMVYALKKDILLAGLFPSQTSCVLEALPEALRSHFVPARSIWETSLGNVGMLLHPLPTLLNTGWIESPFPFKYYSVGITPSIAALLEKLDTERMKVADMLSCNVPSLLEWLINSYALPGKPQNIDSAIHMNPHYLEIDAPNTLEHRYLYEDIPMGLLPLSELGKKLGCRMPLCDLLVELGSQLTGVDFHQTGRTLERLGLAHLTPEELKTKFS